ncbi:MAG: SUMF1/EgtB/PvdO family nonheme iron enzyme, partial [Nitrospinae bacterium]|nr:SUMF1/EgtB/PvdO family nonheme iron enzyme [Nitrospinota bacterium]
SFLIDIHEVTQKRFRHVMGENPSDFEGPNLPVERVSWYEAAEYCKKLGKRLPTEAEWERAAKGGVDSTFAWGENAESKKANFCDQRCNKHWKENQFDDGYRHTAPVGSFPANGYGVFDMAGNVYEWVADWYDEGYYRISPRDNPQGPIKGKRKVIRGGSWINYSVGVRPSDRTEAKPKGRLNFVGFRCAL